MNLNQIINTAKNINNPVVQNALNLCQKGDAKGVEQLARQVCKSKGLNIDEILKQIGGNAR